ncbi:MAG: TetR family transcriptional regulator C-terminal domain-containing protein [Pseudomonadota bacterium]
METSNVSSAEAGRTASKEVRRQQLIDATIESIADHGLSQTTMATITKRANLSQGIVNFHFESKERLLVETIGYLAEEHHALWRKLYAESGSSAQEKLAALVEADFHPTVCNRRRLSVWFAFYGEQKYRTAYRESCSDIDTDRVSELEHLCEEIKREGGYEQVDTRMFAQTLEAFSDGLWLNILLYPQTFSRQRGRDECFAYLASVFPEHFSATMTQPPNTTQ